MSIDKPLDRSLSLLDIGLHKFLRSQVGGTGHNDPPGIG